MSREQNHHIIPVFLGEFLQLVADRLGEGFHESRVRGPAVDGGPHHVAGLIAAVVVPVDGVQAASRRRATVLWVLGEGDRTLNAVTE